MKAFNLGEVGFEHEDSPLLPRRIFKVRKIYKPFCDNGIWTICLKNDNITLDSDLLDELIKRFAEDCPHASIWQEVAQIKRDVKRRKYRYLEEN